MISTEVRNLITEEIERVLMSRPQAFTPERQDVLEQTAATVATMTRDESLGRVLGGSLWLSGVSILNGTVTADKLQVNNVEAITINTGSLNVTGTIVAAASYPATGARIEINSNGIKGYNSTPAQSFGLNTDGSGQLGIGATQVTWTTAGVVSIPVASISALTIAAVGSGNLGGTYATSASSTRLEFAPSYFRALSGGVETFRVSAATGNVLMTGNFDVVSAATGSHIKIDSAGGIAGYNGTSESAGTRTFLLNAATGAGHLGLASGGNQGISWDASGVVSIGGATFSGGKIQAGSLSVSTLSAITADLGTITAGTVTGATFRTSASNPRAIMDTSGFASYDSGGTQRVNLANTGSGWLGASNVISWTTGGAVTISGWTANSTSFTGGSITLNSGGDLTVGTGNNVVRLSTTDGSNRFWIGHATSTSAPFRVTSTGAVTIEGSSAFTIQSASSGSRVALSAGSGLQIFNSGTLRAELAPNGSGFLGSTDGTSVNAAIAWTTGGTATINASRITVGTMTFGASGTVNSTGAVAGTLGNISVSGLTVTGNITLGSGGKIIDADTSEWNQNGIILKSSGIFGDAIKWQNGGTDLGSVYATVSAMVIQGPPASGGATVELFGDEAIIRYNGTNASLQLQSTNRRSLFSGYIYPGSGSGTQTSRYLSDNGSQLGINGPINLANHTVGGSAANWSAGSPTGAGYIVVYIGGVASRIPFWADA